LSPDQRKNPINPINLTTPESRKRKKCLAFPQPFPRAVQLTKNPDDGKTKGKNYQDIPTRDFLALPFSPYMAIFY